MRDLIGTTLGKYSIVSLLGRGGMANVYRAHQPRLDRYVAIKVLHSHLAEEPSFVGRFEREATAVAQLSHPGIVKIHDFDADDGLYYMVMELINGPTLKAEIHTRRQKEQPFSLGELDKIISAVTDAVGYAHDRGITHRDLKPSNVMLTEEGQVVITDFGLAHILGGTQYTQAGTTSGTPEYMSPEQAQGERGDERSDIYSLGVILYEMVTGELPFSGETPLALIVQHIQAEPTPPSQINPDLSLTLEGVILTALHKDPTGRFQSMADLSQALAAALAAVHPAQASLAVLAPALEADDLTDSRLQGTDFRRTRPYRGLFAFREEDAPFFFGRESFTKRLANTVQENAMVAVVGPSGSGKSSVVFAGLIPHLRQSANWTIVDVRLGNRPFQALANALVPLLEANIGEVESLVATRNLAQALGNGTLPLGDVVERILQKKSSDREGDSTDPTPDEGGRLLLVVDQFEEIYTLCDDVEERQRFTATLLDAVRQQEAHPANFCLVLTLRADFMGQALADRTFADALQQVDVKLGPMTRDELAQAVEQPAARLGVGFEPGLIERILDDVGGEPGNLPLLEFALSLLWDRRAGRRLTHAAYEAIGRVEGALARYADKVYARLSEKEQGRVRHIFTQMVRPGEGTEDTRRLATRAELGEENWPLTQRLADERLAVTGQDPTGQETAEMIHEALIRGWKRLQDWMNADRNFRAWQERMRAGLRQWENSGQDQAVLLRGSVLTEAENWQTTRGDELGKDEHAFIQASVTLRQQEIAERQAQQERELEAARKLAESERQRAESQTQAAHKLRQRAWLLSGALVITIVMAVLAALLGRQATINAQQAEEQRQVVEQQRNEAETQRQEAEHQTEVAEQEREQAEQLRQVAEQQRQEADQLRQIALARQLAAESTNLLDEQIDRALLLSLEANNIFDTVETRSSLLTALQHNPNLITLLRAHPMLQMVEFSPDGRLLASVGGQGSVRLWSIEYPSGGNPTIQPFGEPLQGHDENELVNDVDFSPDGQTLATASDDLTVKLWDVASGELLTTLEGSVEYVQAVDFSPDGHTIASAGGENLIRLWDADSGEAIGVLEGPTPMIDFLTFSPDGQTLANTNADKTISLWDMESLQARGQPLSGHGGNVRSIEFGQYGQTLLSTDVVSPVVRIWDVVSGTLSDEFDTGYNLAIADFDLSPDGGQIAIRTADGNIEIWDMASREVIAGPFPGNTSQLGKAEYSPDGRLLASGDEHGTILVWDAGGELGLGQTWEITASNGARYVAFSPDGQIMATIDDTGSILLHDIENGQLTREPLQHASIESVGVSGVAVPSDWYMISTQTDGTLAYWLFEEDGQASRSRSGLYHLYGPTTLALSPDENWFAIGDIDGHISLWQSTPRYISFLNGHEGKVNDLAFNPSETILASAGDDGNVYLWDVNPYRPTAIGVLSAQESGVRSVAISPDEQIVAAGGHDGSIQLWSLQGQEALSQVQAAHDTVVLALGFDGEDLLSIGQNGHTVRWDLSGDEPLGQTLLEASADPITQAVFDGPHLALGYDNGTVQLWDLAGEQSKPLEFGGGTTDDSAVLSLFLNGTQLSAGRADGSISLWDLPSSAEPRTWAHENPISITPTGLAFSPDGRFMATSGYNGTVLLWDVATGRPLYQFSEHPTIIESLAFSADSRLIATGTCAYFDPESNTCAEGKINLWDVQAMLQNEAGPAQPIRTMVGHATFVQSIAFSPNGTTMASGSCGLTDALGYCNQGEIIFWDVDSGRQVGQAIRCHNNQVNQVLFSPDGTLLASAGHDHTVMLWDAATGQQVGQDMSGHSGYVLALAFSPDGTMLASGGYGEIVEYQSINGEIMLWDVATGQRIGRTMYAEPSVVYDLAFSPDGEYLASTTYAGALHLWDVNFDHWRRRACRIANRNLSPQEWSQIFGQEVYRETCPGVGK